MSNRPRDHFDTPHVSANATAAMVIQDEPEYNSVFREFMKKAGHLVFHAPAIAFIPRTYPHPIENMIGRKIR